MPSVRRFWEYLPPWLLPGVVAVLFPVFTVLIASDIQRQKDISLRLLSEKGAALIRSFEAGARTGMKGGHGTRNHLQLLLRETALQEDILYLLVTDQTGRILASSEDQNVGQLHAGELDLESLGVNDLQQQRILETENGQRVFEIFRIFTPLASPPAMGRGRGRGHHWPPPSQHYFDSQAERPEIIFVGLDLTVVEEAQRADIRHTLVMGTIMLLAGLTGILLLLILQAFRSTRQSLVQVQALAGHILEHMPIGVVALNQACQLTTCNRYAENLLGISSDATQNQPASWVLPPELWQQVKRLNETKHLITQEIHCHLSSERKLPLEVSAGQMRDHRQQVTGVVLLLRDLREIRALREAVARSRHLASLGRMAAGVAHEIRNPLSSIKGLATYFRERYANVSDDQQTATLMIQEVDRLNRVVSRLLEFARPVKPVKHSTALNDLVDNSLNLIRHQARQQQIEVVAQLPAQPLYRIVDADSISQLLLNLLLNALQAMENGGRLTVTLVHESNEGRARIQIADTGEGIAETDLPGIFDPYFTTRSQGTGLGLAIVHNIVEAHGGQIQVDSRKGAGTVVTVSF